MRHKEKKEDTTTHSSAKYLHSSCSGCLINILPVLCSTVRSHLHEASAWIAKRGQGKFLDRGHGLLFRNLSGLSQSYYCTLQFCGQQPLNKLTWAKEKPTPVLYLIQDSSMSSLQTHTTNQHSSGLCSVWLMKSNTTHYCRHALRSSRHSTQHSPSV